MCLWLEKEAAVKTDRYTHSVRETRFNELFCSASKKATRDWMTQCFLFFYSEIISDLQKVADIYIYIFHPHYETVNILEPFENRFYT